MHGGMYKDCLQDADVERGIQEPGTQVVDVTQPMQQLMLIVADVYDAFRYNRFWLTECNTTSIPKQSPVSIARIFTITHYSKDVPSKAIAGDTNWK